MRTLELPASATPFERGVFHGRALAAEIDAIARIRSTLACEQGMFRSDAELLAVAERHLPLLREFDAALHEELMGIAQGSGVEPARVVVLNHYTDLKDLDPASVLGGAPRAQEVDKEEDCSAIVAATPGGAVLAQTWDMHGSAEPFVVMLHVPAQAQRPEAWLLSIAGCLGMAGMNVDGVAVTINNLKSNDARVGVVWPALVRRILAERSAEAGRDVVVSAPLGSGHHYLVADAKRAFGVETSGQLAEVWAEADLTRVGQGFHHENHCLGVEVAKVSKVSPVSTTLERHAFLEASLRERAPVDAADVWSRLGSHEGYPRSVCTHLCSAEAPHAMKTCAGLLMELGTRRIHAAAGCIHDVTPTHFEWRRT